MYIYIVRLEKEMGFVPVDLPVPWFVIIAESGPLFCHPFVCRYSSIVMCKSISRPTTQLHQVSLLAGISFIDYIISIKVADEVLRNLAALGVLKLRSLLFIVAFHWRHQFRAICCCWDFVPNLIINMPARVPIPNDWHIDDWKVRYFVSLVIDRVAS